MHSLNKLLFLRNPISGVGRPVITLKSKYGLTGNFPIQLIFHEHICIKHLQSIINITNIILSVNLKMTKHIFVRKSRIDIDYFKTFRRKYS